MQQERVMLKLVILCMTLIAFIWLTRGSLCIAHQAGRLGGCGHFGLRIRTVRQPGGGGFASACRQVAALIREHPSAQKKRRA